MLSTNAGTYAVVLRCDHVVRATIGRLGEVTIRKGYYVYVGSAFGSGGVAARVGRHSRTSKRLRWHIDYLREESRLVEAWYTYDAERREHDWLETMIAMNLVPCIGGFGSSDCRCYSHLLRATSRPSPWLFRETTAQKFPAHDRIGVWTPRARL